jgi:hypothetical protein
MLTFCFSIFGFTIAVIIFQQTLMRKTRKDSCQITVDPPQDTFDTRKKTANKQDISTAASCQDDTIQDFVITEAIYKKAKVLIQEKD